MRRHYLHTLIALVLIIPLILFIVLVSNKKNEPPRQTSAQAQTPTVTVLAKNLEVPWALDFLPDGNIIFTERPGRVKILNVSTGQITQVGEISVLSGGEAGLMGIAVHPQFATNNYVYVYYTYSGPANRLVRYTLSNNQLTAPTTLIDAVPGATTHDGGRIKFGPDGFLYIATGDGQTMPAAQDPNSLAGKILRVTDTGAPAPGNPLNNRTYSYGHRNPQGITWIGNQLYTTEHGNSHPSRGDELNFIQPGKNYGWPEIEAGDTREGMETPMVHSGTDASTTWAPSGTAYWNGAIFVSTLKGQGLYEFSVQGSTGSLKAQHLKGEYGRLREAVVGPDNQLYVTTSNKDGRGTPKAEDDKILKISFGIPPSTQPSVPIITPSWYPIVPCPTCSDPSISPVPSSGVGPSTGVIPSTITAAPQPTVDPCTSDSTSIAHDKKSKHREHDGAISGFMELLLRFLIELLNLILRLIGGGSIPTPNPTPTPSVPVDPSMSPDPCGGTVPSEAPQSTIGPSTSPSAVPSSAVSTVPSVAQPISTAPSTAPSVGPSQTLACVPSGQACDATGARKCCTNACVKNINPNYPNDPGTCD